MKIIKINRQDMPFIGRLSLLALIIMMTFPVSAEDNQNGEKPIAASNEVEFESDLLRTADTKKIDLRRFSQGSNASPGIYRVNIFVNNVQVDHDDVEFKESSDKKVYACLTPKLIRLINFKEETLSSEVRAALAEQSACTDLHKLIPDARVDFDNNEQQLNIEVPQLYVNRSARGSVSPELWDSGIPALLLGYYINGYDSKNNSGYDSRSLYASFNTGLNIGAWYLRHNGAYNWQKGFGGKYTASNTYLQRDIAAVRGRLILGETNTSGQIFNSLPFTGLQISSDDRMLPDSMRGFAPEIRGIAKTNAKVTIRQLGNIIYETTVTPGAFLINDLYPTGYGGDLDVTILEADGSVQRYTLPYASVAQLLRPGVHQYSLTVGKLRNTGISEEPMVYEATYQRGLNNIFTGYGGAQANQNYQAVQLGTAMGTRFGAVGVDVTQSSSKLGNTADSTISGQSYRVSYSKLIDATDSNISLAAYRFSSSGYMDFLTAMQSRDAVKQGYDPDTIKRSKNRFTLTINQGLSDTLGSVYASASMENYWGSVKGYNKQYQVGYANSYKRLSYSINVSRSKSAFGVEQTTWYLNFSVPLWEDRSTRAPYFSLRHTQDDNGAQGQQAMLSGSLGENNKYNYNLTASHDNHSGSSQSMAGSWQGSKAQVNGSYSRGRDYQSTTLGMSGAVVVHSGGITLSPYNSDSFALIEAKGAEGAKVAGYAGAEIDSFGYALFPSPSPYQLNHVAIDPEGSSLDVEFENTAQKVVPRAGAVVKVKFKTRSGTPILIISLYEGQPVPFGAEVFDSKNLHVGTVSQGGMIYARVTENKGTLLIKWGDDSQSRCQVSYMLAPVPVDKNKKNVLQQFNIPCRLPD